MADDERSRNMQTDGPDLSGQVALITGGGRGLGRAIAQALAADGMAVALAARSAAQLEDTVRLIKGAGGRARAFPLDVTDRGAVESMVEAAQEQLGPIDLLINNAAVVNPLGPIWEVDPDEWWQTFAINLNGPFLCARSVLPGMIARRRGRIVNMSSGAGLETHAYWTAYVTTKAALMRFSDCLAEETRPYGISVFAIDPGAVDTAMTRYLIESGPGKTWMPEFRQIFDQGRNVPPERVVALVRFIARGHADPLSGCYLSVTHDVAELVRHAAKIVRAQRYTLRLRV